MIRKIERTWFEVWGSECAQNRILKGLLALSLSLCTVETVALAVLASKAPTLIAVSALETKVLVPSPPTQELVEQEVKRVAIRYLTFRHNWEWQRVEAALKEASRYVDPNFTKTFTDSTASQVKLARSKKVSQRFYIASLSVDLAAKALHVTGDRILLVEGLRATNSQTFDMTFGFGPRTKDNPEGVYVTGDNLVPESSEPNPNGGTKR